MIVFTGMMVVLQTMAPFELEHVGAWEPADVKACILFGWKWNPKSRIVGELSCKSQKITRLEVGQLVNPDGIFMRGSIASG
jgi:hypothetical protein